MLNYLRQSLSCSAGFRATLISLILESLFARAVLHRLGTLYVFHRFLESRLEISFLGPAGYDLAVRRQELYSV